MKKIKRREFLTLMTFGTATIAVYGKNPFLGFKNSKPENEIFHFRIGHFKCINFNTGHHAYPATSFFENVPAEVLQKELGLSTPPESITSAYASVFIDTGKNKVLIDCGIGTFWGGPDLLQKHLRQEGISNDSIDTIIITHAHPDHYGGILDSDGNPLFPNARYFSNKIEWTFYNNDELFKAFKAEHAEFVNKLGPPAIQVYKTIKDKMVFVEPGEEIIPGIKVIDAKGHTPGQLAVVVSSKKDKLINIADVVFHPLHLKYPDWLPHPRYIVDPAAFKKTIKRIFAMAADENMLVSAMHFNPAPSLGRVKKNGDGFDWYPILDEGLKI